MNEPIPEFRDAAEWPRGLERRAARDLSRAGSKFGLTQANGLGGIIYLGLEPIERLIIGDTLAESDVRCSSRTSGCSRYAGRKGEPAADFLIDGPAGHGLPRLVNLFGIESPGLTSSLSIAEEVVGQIQ